MNLRALQKHWNILGKSDPLRAILTRSRDKDAPWDPAKFFESGVFEIDQVLSWAEAIRPLGEKRRALDFGCGVGRLTQALASRFDRVCGVDISAAMIERAREFDRSGGRSEFVVNETADLRRFPDGHFDFVYSSITLQHMPQRFAKRYMVEFLRVLDTSGLLLFQLPSHRIDHYGWLISRSQRIVEPVLHPFAPRVVMRGIPKSEVVELLARNGGEVLEVGDDQSAGEEWKSYRYLVAKAAKAK